MRQELEEWEQKIRHEEMIRETILRIREQYVEAESAKAASDKLAESDKRIGYLKAELNRLVSKLCLDSPKSDDSELARTVSLLNDTGKSKFGNKPLIICTHLSNLLHRLLEEYRNLDHRGHLL